jgi:hypothetical protein
LDQPGGHPTDVVGRAVVGEGDAHRWVVSYDRITAADFSFPKQSSLCLYWLELRL